MLTVKHSFNLYLKSLQSKVFEQYQRNESQK